MNSAFSRIVALSLVMALALQASAAGEAGTPKTDSVVGRQLADFVLPDSTGKQMALADFNDAKLVVVVFMGTACPIGNAYVPDLNDLQKRYRDQKVQVIGINSNLSDSPESIAKHVEEFKVNFPVLVDVDQLAADLFGARRTPESFVLDRRRTVRYQGRIDDRVGYTFKRDKSRRADLEEAVKELLKGEKVSIADTELEGCVITRRSSLRPNGEITYAKHVAEILHNRCAGCHHKGTAAPFSLLTYEDAQEWSGMIRETVVQRRMPPWNIDPRYGKFKNDLRMTPKEINTLVAWIDDGAPFGDKKDLPKLPVYEDGWIIGKPDIVLKMPRVYEVKATGTVEYKYFVTPTNFNEDVWVQASEARPGNRAVVHHIIAFIREKNARGRMGSIGGFAPGEEPLIYPAGIGKKIPAGAEIVWQVHYTPTGKAETDQCELGLILCKEPPQRVAKGGGAFNRSFSIPAGAGNHRAVSRARFTKDVELLSLMPHMHLRGKDFRYTAHYPDGSTEILLNVPNYDFNWQHRYLFAKPFPIPKGTTIECVAHFDNSAENPANPDPTEIVRWGDQTWEEMMIGWYAHVDAIGAKTDTPKKESADRPDTALATPLRIESPKPQQDTAQQDTAQEDTSKTTDSSTSVKMEIGRVLKRTYDFKEAKKKEMEYALYLPKGYDAGKTYPLIVALHGLGSNPRQILGYPGFTSHADKHGYILVAPYGYNSRGWYGSRGKGGGRGSDPKNLGELSEKDVLNVLELTRKQLKIDNERIYLLGHSMGGGGSFHLAIGYPNIWAAMAPLAPAVSRRVTGLEKAKHIPAIVVQGDKDSLVPVSGTRRWIAKMKELGMDHQYIEVKGGDHVTIAFRHFDEIFEFFDARSKGKPKKVSDGTSDS